MRKNIIVIGASPSGIAVAALLAKAGMEVTVYEERKRAELPGGKLDVLPLNALKIAGIKPPPPETYHLLHAVTMYSPDQQTTLTQPVPEEQMRIYIAREKLTYHLITHAEKAGVNFIFECSVLAPIMLGNRVAGIQTNKGEVYANLVIDSCGIYSPVRRQLPDMCQIEQKLRPHEKLPIYQFFCERIPDSSTEHVLQIFLKPTEITPIAWAYNEKDSVRFSLGCYGRLQPEQFPQLLSAIQQKCPWVGPMQQKPVTSSVISARHPLSIMVCDGYAAIGNSAFMTMPLLGNEISNCLKAARILSNAILADKDCAYSAHSLWSYQVMYFKKIGGVLAQNYCLKDLLLELSMEELDMIFSSGIITAEDLALASQINVLSPFLRYSSGEPRSRLESTCQDRTLLRKLLSTSLQMGRVSGNTSLLPKQWSPDTVSTWAKRYRSLLDWSA